MTGQDEKFSVALAAADQSAGGSGIGTLGQKMLHAVLKHYYAPNPDWQEQRVGRFVVDVSRPDGIYEIQTRQLDKLRPKLQRLLPEHPVTVVYPLPRLRYLAWVDPDTGEVSKLRKSPKTGYPCDALPELGRLREFLHDPHFHVRVLLLDLEEYRFLNGYGANRKRGASRCERIPRALAEEIRLDTAADYLRLLPETLPERCTAQELAAAARLRGIRAWTAKELLLEAGALEPCGKRGRATLYQVNHTLS